ncbi:MAG: hypothetical protein JW829_12605 [Pirellulales bacterium]|nr:hypothetical protein [Pirellulales bacterium]
MHMIFHGFTQLIGYVCVGTVLAGLLGFGFLWHSGKLTNEKVFQIFALVQDVNLEEIAAVEKETGDQTPLPEEPSLEQLERNRALLDRNHEIKSEQLTRQIAEFKHIRDLLASEMVRRDTVAQTLDARLAQAEADAIQEGNTEVARHFNLMKAQQVKEEMMKMIENDELETVISLLNTMSDTQMKKVLQQFRTDEDITTIHTLHRLMTEGFPKKEVAEQIKKELQELQTD